MRTWIKFVIGILVGCRITFAAEELKTDVKLLLSPTESVPFDSRTWAFSLVLKGVPVSVTTGHEEKENSLYYRESPPVLGHRDFIAFTGVRSGEYTLVAGVDRAVGFVEFALAEINVHGNRAIVVDVPPFFSIEIMLGGEEVLRENALFALHFASVDGDRRYYRGEIPMGIENGKIAGTWDFLLVPRKYKLKVVQYGRDGEGAYVFEKDLGTVDVTANDVMKGSLTLDAKKHQWRDTMPHRRSEDRGGNRSVK